MSGADLHVGIDDAGLGPKDCDPLGHQLRSFARAQDGIEAGQFGAGYSRRALRWRRRLEPEHGFSGAAQNARQIGQIILAVRIVGGELIDVARTALRLGRRRCRS